MGSEGTFIPPLPSRSLPNKVKDTFWILTATLTRNY